MNQILDGDFPKRGAMYTRSKTTLLLTLIVGLLAIQFSQSTIATSGHKPDAAYMFVEVETKVYRKGVEISSENPSERRWYISNVVVQPEDVPTYSLVKKKVVPYFSRNVMDPFEARGFSLDYGDQDVRLNGESSYANYATRQEAEEARNKAIEYRKNQSGNIYSFELVFGGTAKGEETQQTETDLSRRRSGQLREVGQLRGIRAHTPCGCDRVSTRA